MRTTLLAVALLVKVAIATASEEARHILTHEYQLAEINLMLDAEELGRQRELLKNQQPFAKALRLAMESFLYDASEPESPLALMYDVACEKLLAELRGRCFAKQDWHPRVKLLAQQLLGEALNRNDTTISLLSLDHRPERQEDPRDSWIFELYIASLSDHWHWAIVDRLQRKSTYNYGFN